MQQLIRQPLFVDLTLTTLLTSLLWITACNPKTDDSLREISRIIRAKNDSSTYELVAITIHDTLITADLLKDLNSRVNDWRLEHEQINNQFYKEALFFFGADHVKHLHQDKLKVLDYLDSMELIQAYLMNFPIRMSLIRSISKRITPYIIRLKVCEMNSWITYG